MLNKVEKALDKAEKLLGEIGGTCNERFDVYCSVRDAITTLTKYQERLESEELLEEMAKAYLNHDMRNDPDAAIFGKVACGMKSVLNVIKVIKGE